MHLLKGTLFLQYLYLYTGFKELYSNNIIFMHWLKGNVNVISSDFQFTVKYFRFTTVRLYFKRNAIKTTKTKRNLF